MKVQDNLFDISKNTWETALGSSLDSPRTLVLAFGAQEVLNKPAAIADLARTFPKSIVLGCSSAGEVHGTTVRDGSISVTVSQFEKTDLSFASCEVKSSSESFASGQQLAKKLKAARPKLRGVLILSEGLNVNGSELVRGLNSVLDDSIVVTGGLSGDGSRFQKTWVSVGDRVASNVIAAVGFYGDHVAIGHGSKGGWDRFGPERVVTKSEANVLYELDGKPALALYKEYLGEKAKDLPGSGLLFPLSMRSNTKDTKYLVRTLLAVDHEKNSMTFAGDIPQGFLVQLMKADFERLIDGAALASAMAQETANESSHQRAGDSLVLAISCVGRRLVLGERAEEEIEAVLDGFPQTGKAKVTGFYSYGEISPYATGQCDLHNQTMTLTVFSESSSTRTYSRGTPKIPLPPVPTPTNRPALRASGSAPRLDVSKLDALAGDVPKLFASPSATTTGNTNAPSHGGFQMASLGYSVTTKTWSAPSFPRLDSPRTLVLAFGAPEILDDPAPLRALNQAYPKSIIVGCSSSGEVHGTQIMDHSLAVSVSRFEKTELRLASISVRSATESFSAGQMLARKLVAEHPSLRGVLVLSEGLNVNGSELVRGLNGVLDDSIVVTGGLSGDGTAFKRTWVAIGGVPEQNLVVAVGFYGDHVLIGHGSKGGWDKFGHERVVTRSEGNVLYELDGKPALALYKEYLGPKASELPASGLLFPLSMRASASDEKHLVRTLLAVDHDKNSMTFAGDVPKGHLVQLMRADFDRLIGGASLAAASARAMQTKWTKESLILAISCVGRRLVLGDRTEDELEAVLQAFPGAEAKHLTGFYSYGELSPYGTGQCDLHNQTMTLTVIGESEAKVTYATNVGKSKAVQEIATIPPQHTVGDWDDPPTAELDRTSLQAAALPKELDSRSVPALAASDARLLPIESTRLPFQGTGAANVTIDRKMVGDVAIVSLRGKLSESFRGEELGRSLSGTVILDLAEVERITSFGVREWLNMIAASKGATIYAVRASEAIVNQLAMIRKFAGHATIVSFYSPYLCGACGASFERLWDLEDDVEALRTLNPKNAKCPSCEGVGRFDDDPLTYFAFTNAHLGSNVPANVRAITRTLVATLVPEQRDPIDKIIDGKLTRLRVQSKLTPDFRWPRIFDGLEGRVAIDLGGVGAIVHEGAHALLNAVSGLGDEVESVRFERAPQKFVDVYMQSDVSPRVSIASMTIDASCSACNAVRPTLVSGQEHEATLLQGALPTLRCRRCNGPLTIATPERLSALMRSSSIDLTPPPTGQYRLTDAMPPRSSQLPVAPAPASVAPAPAAPAPASPAHASGPSGATLLTGLVAAGAIAAALYFGLAKSGQRDAPAAVPSTIPVAVAAPSTSAVRESAEAELPPGWVERDFAIENGFVTIVGHAGNVASAEEGTRAARTEAIVELVKHIQADLSGPLAEFLSARAREDMKGQRDAIADRFVKQVGSFGVPERIDAYVRRRGTTQEFHGRYRISQEAYTKVLSYYKDTGAFSGIVVARVFPTLEAVAHTNAELVIVNLPKGRADLQGMRVGDYITAVDDKHPASPDAFARTALDAWNGIAIRGTLSIETEAGGAKKVSKLFKAPPN
jgi:hypothetical protein